MNKRGGVRKGAGRPKAAIEKITLSVKVPLDVKAWLDAHEESSGKLVEEGIRKLMNKSNS
jgi:hypothetical protein